MKEIIIIIKKEKMIVTNLNNLSSDSKIRIIIVDKVSKNKAVLSAETNIKTSVRINKIPIKK